MWEELAKLFPIRFLLAVVKGLLLRFPHPKWPMEPLIQKTFNWIVPGIVNGGMSRKTEKRTKDNKIQRKRKIKQREKKERRNMREKKKRKIQRKKKEQRKEKKENAQKEEREEKVRENDPIHNTGKTFTSVSLPMSGGRVPLCARGLPKP